MTTIPAEPRVARYTVGLARTAAELREAQSLRHRVFAEEMGARLDTPVNGLDADPLDAYCDHLLVRHGETGEVVGTYRLLAPGRADRLYADSAFDLGALAGIRPGLVEAGRACVHAGHRGGAVVGLMWAGIARYMVERGYDWLAGCCSVPVSQAAEVVRRVPLGPPEYRVAPLRPWRGGEPARTARPLPDTGPSRPDGAGGAPGGARPGSARPGRAGLPPLLRGYLRLGAWVCGPPADDREFGVADFFVLLPMAGVDPRYLRHFLGAPE
ncbi:GNAT family N-acetyltransferase [Planomonospora sp. ID67723]|uniref:GNAT family N-acetyltransferase n=1 Tax=Planomonospora sp. ID67723 TaxID=2738134 RepID=UPI0018C45073|nr:GNAT family N-acyltransferase [Planomonospora sp. ID67723]MBG0827276.1 GNAT family N-acetyltransferase [Planomonospora sp. ID67723]